jgi:hypothetical protein
MPVVSDARSALQNGASTVLSTVQRNKITRRLLPARTQKMMKQWNRSLEPRRPQTLPLVLVAVGLSLAATAASIFVSRYLLARNADEEAVATVEEMVVAEEPVLAD